MKFVDRDREIEILKGCKKLAERKLYSVIVTGMRRVGKTRLIFECFKNDFLYFFVDKDKGINQIVKEIEEELKRKNIISEFYSLNKFEDVLKVIAENYKGVVVFDEFQDFYKIDRSVFGTFQKFFDLEENKKGILFVFSGSLIGLIKKLLSIKSPLYGRIKRKITLKPLDIKSVIEMCNILKIKNFEDVLKLYFVFSGFPKYYVAIEDENLAGKNFERIIERFFLEFDAVLEDEVERILSMEFGRRKSTYYALLAAIAEGKTKLGEIASSLNLKLTSITRQLKELVDFFELVGIEKQVFGKKKAYFIKHPLILFWFRFFYKYKSAYLKREKWWMEYFRKNLNAFFGLQFEKFIMEHLGLFIRADFTRIGRQWGKIPKAEKGKNTYEIDIIALDERRKKALVAECKWKERVNAEKVAKELEEKVGYVKELGNYKIEYGVFAKGFSKRVREFNGKKVYCFGLRELAKVLRGKV